MPVSQTPKLGTSVDIADLLAQRKRNTLNQVIASQKAAGIYKPHLSERSFEMINLQRQAGLDSELVIQTRPFKEFPRRFFRKD
jgi:hypothetical protein